MAQSKNYITNTSTKLLDATELKSKFTTLNKKSPVKALSTELSNTGFKAITGKDAYFGGTETYKTSDGKSLSVSFAFQSYTNSSTKDEGTIGVITLKSSEGESYTYNFSLIASKGDFNKITEYFADKNNKVVKTNSWSSRWKACLKKKCVSTCVAALLTCSGTWAAYFACVALVCGGCCTLCVACASCECKWWCKGVSGCCKD
jgi:hypothetical protein